MCAHGISKIQNSFINFYAPFKTKHLNTPFNKIGLFLMKNLLLAFFKE
jgi:hypothetical protein